MTECFNMACPYCMDYQCKRTCTCEYVKVKHGRWKGAGMGDYMCSWCGEVVSGNRYHYCPNCGADMREVEE